MSPAKKPGGGTGRRSTAKKTTAKTTKKTVARKSTAKKSTAKKPAAKKTSARSAKTAAARSAAKKTTAKKAVAKKSSARAARSAPPAKATRGKSTASKKAPVEAPRKTAPPARPFVKPVAAALPKRKVRPAKFDADQLKKIRAGLETKRGELEKRIAELEEDSFDSTQSDITGEVGLDEDFADAGTATFDRERDLSIRNNIRDLIDQMDRAIARIDEGSYGTCERCGNPIDAARLRELPHASLCLDCKRREERAR